MSDKIQELVASIKSNEAEISEMSQSIKDYYNDIQVKFTANNGIRNAEIDQVYKKIDSTFNAKAKLETKVRNAKTEILSIMLV